MCVGRRDFEPGSRNVLQKKPSELIDRTPQNGSLAYQPQRFGTSILPAHEGMGKLC